MSAASERIAAMLREAFDPEYLHVEDESWKHAGHAGARESGGGHFVVQIASRRFAGKSRLECHRMIHEALKPLFPSVIHALSIQIKPCG